MASNTDSITNDPDTPVQTNSLILRYSLTLSLMLPPRNVDTV